jgi:preprotein translocase subunit SecA
MMRLHEKYLLLQVIDQQWKEHLLISTTSRRASASAVMDSAIR